MMAMPEKKKIDPVMEQFFAAATDPRRAMDFVQARITDDDKKTWEGFYRHQCAINKAMAKPLPGAAGEAYLQGAISIGDFTVYEVMPIHLKCLQLVNSPLLDMVSSAAESGQVKRDIENEDEWNLCLIFTLNPENLYDQPKASLKAFIETTAKKIFKPVNAATVNGICSAIIKQFERHVATSIRFSEEINGQKKIA